MNNKPQNPCTRCGKERILLKTWEERMETFSGVEVIQINSKTICPDKKCQKIVEKDLKVQKDKREKVRHEREERAAEQKLNNPRNKKKIGK